MKIIHTSDWHLGRRLYGRQRYGEFSRFLDWLVGVIQQEKAQALLVAGDIFDSSTPSNRALELYYQFLCRVAGSCCRHIVITAGNHDSPSLLNAPKEVLRFLDVHVIGSISDALEDEVLLLRDEGGVPELIVCAVPYLRDRDIRKVDTGESVEDKGRKLIEGIRSHYQAVLAIAEQVRCALTTGSVPIVAMGHLFSAGAQTSDGDGVRELYVGSLAHVGLDIFPQSIDYVALGHLHMPQQVAGADTRRYSGSPLPMGFGEAGRQKKVLAVTLSSSAVQVDEITVPCFQDLVAIKGNWQKIRERIEVLQAADSSAWLEIIYDGDEIVADLQQRVRESLQGTALRVLRIKNQRIVQRALHSMGSRESLDDLSVEEVFVRCLDAHQVLSTQRQALLDAFQETVIALHEEDGRAE